MRKQWTALALAAAMLLTAACGRQIQPQEDEPASSASHQQTQPPAQEEPLPEEEPAPVKEVPKWETNRTLEHLPDSYSGLELPVQGATGYASIELPLWAAVEDYEAAKLAVEEWEEAQRLAEEQAAAQAGAQQGQD